MAGQEQAMAAAGHAAKDDASFFGHPRGLATLAFTETFVAFSYYGMQSLLVLYLNNHLLQPGVVDHVLGIGPFRALVGMIYGDSQGQALAAAIVGIYSALAFATPLLGGIVADRWLGRTATIALGAILMTFGHFFMVFESLLLPALLCLVLGTGCAGVMKAQLAGLYGEGDLRRGDAFQIYLLAVNLSVIAAPVICGALGEQVAWGAGFGSAGIGMLIGLIVYMTRLHTLPPEPPRRRSAAGAETPRMQPGDWRRAAALILLLPVLSLVLVGNQELVNGYLLWAEHAYAMRAFGFTIPTSWLVSFDALIAVATLFLSVAFWRWWRRYWREPDEIDKLACASVLIALAPLILAAGAAQISHGGKLGFGWALAFHTLNDIGFANFYAIGLALFARVAPKAMAATLIAGYSLHLFLCNLLVGKLAGLLTRMDGTSFWVMHAAIIAVGGVILILAARFGRRTLVPASPA